ncbi:Transposase [Oopsacas minuta]|uniref:Transposase n=1 Tax=Oopsacas minuta TaxID=111878 RepID=A0AAV7JDL3_9METZ|nr:Transposase [Oopsacas minuta]
MTSNIEFPTILKVQPVQIFSELQEILCVDCPSRSTLERWAARLRSSDADVTDLPRSVRPVSATNSENIALNGSMVREDKCITVNQLEQITEISSGAIHTILTTELGYRSICGKLVSHKLSENHRLARLNIAKKLLETYENCDSRCLTEIITGDETWMYYSTPYSKYKKRSWVRGDKHPAKIPRLDFRKPKIMQTILVSSHGIVFQLTCKSGKVVTATFFTEQVLFPNLIKNIEKYRPKTGTRGMKILIDNASFHTAKLTKNFLDVEGLELLPYSLYSPNLALCDFWLFPSLKSIFKAKILTHYKPSERACYSTSNPSPKKSTGMCFQVGGKVKTLCIWRRGLL